MRALVGVNVPGTQCAMRRDACPPAGRSPRRQTRHPTFTRYASIILRSSLEKPTKYHNKHEKS